MCNPERLLDPFSAANFERKTGSIFVVAISDKHDNPVVTLIQRQVQCFEVAAP